MFAAKRHLRTVLSLGCAVVLVMLVVNGCSKKEKPAAPPNEHESVAPTTERMAMGAAEIEQTTCPVMDGNKIDKNVFVEYKGKKVYFCCPECKAKFEAEPEKYIAKLPQFKQ